jgi:hypothetical protein
MNPYERRIAQAERLRKRTVSQALSLLESCTEYPTARARFYEERSTIDQNTRNPERTDQERLDLLLRIFDIRAKAYLGLVSNLPLQKAYLPRLTSGVRTAARE